MIDSRPAAGKKLGSNIFGFLQKYQSYFMVTQLQHNAQTERRSNKISFNTT